MPPLDASPKKVLIAGLGRQGWAIARQLLKLEARAPTLTVYVYDVDRPRLARLLQLPAPGDPETPVTAALRDGRLKPLELPAAEPGDLDAVGRAIRDLAPDLLINASSFKVHAFYTRTAFEADCDYLDLGQDTWRALKQRAYDQRIREAGKRMRMVPECGLAPGLVNVLGDWLLGAGGDTLELRVGGLPMDTAKGEGLHYGISWSVAGLVQEYTDVTIARQRGRLASVAGLTSRQDREGPDRPSPGVAPFRITDERLVARLQGRMEDAFFGPAGDGAWEIRRLEARPTSDGISLMPFDGSFADLDRLEYKTLRYDGHFDLIERWHRQGTLERELAARREPGLPDLVLLRAWTESAGAVEAMVEAVVLADPELDGGDPEEAALRGEPVFSAMELMTGWPTVLAARTLLATREGFDRAELLAEDRELWSGRRLHEALAEGGVVMPYELLDGGRLLAALDTDLILRHRAVRCTGAASELARRSAA